MHNNTWQTQEAKARFSELVRAVKRSKKPQIITVRGKKEVMLVSYNDNVEVSPMHSTTKKRSGKKPKKRMTLGQLLNNSPLSRLDLSRAEMEYLFGRDRSSASRRMNETLFD